MSDEDIIEQIVLLENINMANISKPMVQKAKKKVIGAINYLGKVIGKNPEIKEPDVKNIWNLIEEKRNELMGTSREELDNRIVEVLKKKAKLTYEEPPYDMLSAKIIDEAGEALKIDKNLTPAQKADSIHRRFYERMLANTQKYLKKQDKKAAKKNRKSIRRQLKNYE
ncbi:hypothetical protein [Clostridium acetireducens]|nr:hypothetical protein [Clostridium acetireducens]